MNGFLNRFLFVACRRTQLLPDGGDEYPLANTGLKDRLAQALDHARVLVSFGSILTLKAFGGLLIKRCRSGRWTVSPAR